MPTFSFGATACAVYSLARGDAIISPKLNIATPKMMSHGLAPNIPIIAKLNAVKNIPTIIAMSGLILALSIETMTWNKMMQAALTLTKCSGLRPPSLSIKIRAIMPSLPVSNPSTPATIVSQSITGFVSIESAI